MEDAIKNNNEKSREEQWNEIVAQFAVADAQQQRALGTQAATPKKASRAPPAPADIAADVTPGELAALRAKYGDAIVKVSVTDPNDMSRGIDMKGHLYAAVWEETRDPETELVFDSSLIGYYHLNRPQLAEFPFDPELSYVPIVPSRGLTTENEKTIRERFRATDADIKHVRDAFTRLKRQMDETPGADLSQSLAFFGQIRPNDITIVSAYDSTDRTTVFAAGVRLPVGRGRYMMADACVNCTKHVMRALIKSDPQRAKKAQRYRIAWYQAEGSPLMGIYAAFMDETPSAPKDPTEEAAIEAITKSLQKTQLFDAPAPNVAAALEELSNISVAVQQEGGDATYKPPGSDVSPF